MMATSQFWDLGPVGVRGMFEAPYRAQQVMDWARRAVVDPQAMHNVPRAVREKLIDSGGLLPLELRAELQSRDGSRKYLFEGPAGEFEAVWMPFADHATLCVSSQAGCRMGCAFCATARLREASNLSVGEIVGQLLHARAQGHPVDRIVFMGMGEPMANYAHVSQALQWFTDPAPHGFGMSAQRITVSTVGYLPQLDQFWQEQRAHLAISLNGYDNASRQAWMPVGQNWSFDKLVDWARARDIRANGRRVTFEYILSGGHTDSVAGARALGQALRGSNLRVNLIPWNAWGAGDIAPTSEGAIDRFMTELGQHGVVATVRRSRALDIAGACGQLANTGREALTVQ